MRARNARDARPASAQTVPGARVTNATGTPTQLYWRRDATNRAFVPVQTMKRAGLLFVILLVASAHPGDTGQASQTTAGSGIQLVQTCRLYFEYLGRTGAGREETLERNPFGMGYCAGLVHGVVDMAETFMPDRVCLPPRSTTAQAVWVVVQYLENNPIALPDEDSELVLRALENTYRCP
jgi:hypothetical protein